MFTKHDLPGNDVASAEGESRDHRRGREIAVMWMVFFFALQDFCWWHFMGSNGDEKWDSIVI